MEDPLDTLIADGVIDEVLGRLKSGKEANISLVRRGDEIMAAKVYKDRTTRSFKNNADYKEGRKVRNSRSQRAMDSGSKFGRDAAEQAWKSAEADALFKLVGSGVRIPTPIMFYEGVLLMDLVRDADGNAAPRLIDVAFDKSSAVTLYADLVAQIISMLCCDLIHGDLSPYNILAAVDGPTIIDFPQVISAAHSSRAEWFFQRDFDNIVAFVSGFDPSLAPHTADGRAIWRAYVSRDLTPEFVPPPPPPPRATRGPDRRGPRPDDRNRGPRGPRMDNGPRGPRMDNRGPQQRADGNRGPTPVSPNGSNNHRGPQQGRPNGSNDGTRGPTPVSGGGASSSNRPDYAADPPKPPPPPVTERPAYAADPPPSGRDPQPQDGRGQIFDRRPQQGANGQGPQHQGGDGRRPPNDRGPQQFDRGPQQGGDGRRAPNDRGPNDRGPQPFDRAPPQPGGDGRRPPNDRGPQHGGDGRRPPNDRGPQQGSDGRRPPNDRGPQQPERTAPQRWDGRGAYPTEGRAPNPAERSPQQVDRSSQQRTDGRGRRGSNGQGSPPPAGRGSQQPRFDGRGPQQRSDGRGSPPPSPPPSSSGYRNPPPPRAAPSFERPPPPRFGGGGGGGGGDRPAGNARRRPRRRG